MLLVVEHLNSPTHSYFLKESDYVKENILVAGQTIQRSFLDVSQSVAMTLELSPSPVERWLRARSSSGVSRAETRLMAVTAMAGSEADTSGVTFCGRMSI